jgi:hypothetical protein
LQHLAGRRLRADADIADVHLAGLEELVDDELRVAKMQS